MIPYGSLWGLWCSQLPSIDHIDPPCLITSFGSVNHPGARPRGEEDVGDGWTIRRHLWCSAEIILRPSSTCSVSRRFKQQFCYAVEGAMIVTRLCIWTPLIDYKFIIWRGLTERLDPQMRQNCAWWDGDFDQPPSNLAPLAPPRVTYMSYMGQTCNYPKMIWNGLYIYTYIKIYKVYIYTYIKIYKVYIVFLFNMTTTQSGQVD